MRIIIFQLFFILCCLISQFTSLNLPNYIQPCNIDEHLNMCAKRQAIATIQDPRFLKGDAKYGLPRMNPLFIPRMVINQGTEQIGLKLDLNNVNIYGLEHIQVLDIRIDLKKKEMEGDFLVPKMEMIGDYKADGKILVLPITGDGKGNITLINEKANFKFDYFFENGKGETYIKINKAKMTFDADRMYLLMENLFQGDKTLGGAMHRFLDENWREVLNELGPSVGDGIGSVFRLIFDNLFKHVPYDRVFKSQMTI